MPSGCSRNRHFWTIYPHQFGSPHSSYKVSPDWRPPFRFNKEQTTETMDSPKTKGLQPYLRQWNLELVGAERLPPVWPPWKIIQDSWAKYNHFHLPCALFLAGVEFHVLPRILACFLAKLDLLFAFGVLSCRILDCASLFISYVHEHDHLGFGMLTMKTGVHLFDCICWFVKFSYVKCVANLSLVPILKLFWRRLMKLFETVTPPSRRMERQTTPSIAGQTSPLNHNKTNSSIIIIIIYYL